MKKVILIATIIIINLLACNIPDGPSACIKASEISVSPNDLIVFNNCSTLETANDSCIWRFGDNTTTITQGIKTVTHSYSQLGQYEVSLEIKVNNTVASKQTLFINVF
jgi:PKD repeat protein